MKKSFSRYFLPFTFLLLPFLLTGCFEDEVKFKGKVLQARLVDITDGTGAIVDTRYTVDGPLRDAVVRCVGHSETAVTDANGLYELSIEVTRVIGFKASADKYTLQAFSQRNYFTGAQDPGTDEPISQYIDARPGDTIPVRDFVLLAHTDERENGSGQ
ncbi:MAG: hypothetical protein WC947_00570 [Elusimicrobiota bacterium]